MGNTSGSGCGTFKEAWQKEARQQASRHATLEDARDQAVMGEVLQHEGGFDAIPVPPHVLNDLFGGQRNGTFVESARSLFGDGHASVSGLTFVLHVGREVTPPHKLRLHVSSIVTVVTASATQKMILLELSALSKNHSRMDGSTNIYCFAANADQEGIQALIRRAASFAGVDMMPISPQHQQMERTLPLPGAPLSLPMIALVADHGSRKMAVARPSAYARFVCVLSAILLALSPCGLPLNFPSPFGYAGSIYREAPSRESANTNFCSVPNRETDTNCFQLALEVAEAAGVAPLLLAYLQEQFQALGFGAAAVTETLRHVVSFQ